MEWLRKQFERVAEAKTTLKINRDLFEKLKAAVKPRQSSSRGDFESAANGFVEKVDGELAKCGKRSPVNLFRIDSLRLAWRLVWIEFESVVDVCRMGNSYDGCGTLAKYVLMVLLRGQTNGLDSTGCKKPVVVGNAYVSTDDSTARKKVHRVLPPVAAKRYDDLAASCIRKVEGKLARWSESLAFSFPTPIQKEIFVELKFRRVYLRLNPDRTVPS